MEKPYYETFHEMNELGMRIAYETVPGGYHPLHWHDEIEFLYQLNGDTEIQLEGRKYQVPKKHLTVIDSRQVHSTYTYSDTSMFICVHISPKYMEKYLPDMELYQIQCIPDEIPDEKFPEYRTICQMLEDLTRIYIEDSPARVLESEGIIMQVLAHLIRHFSRKTVPDGRKADRRTMDRILQMIRYIEEHYQEPLSVGELAEQLGLTKEYFCRFFKKSMGMSFLQYLSEVRISHIYQDLVRSDKSIQEIAEFHGFYNQKLFNQTFKKVYGCTPSSVRKQ